MPEQIPKTVKTERAKRLLKTSSELSELFFRNSIRQNAVILAEKITEDGKVFGHTTNYIPVFAEPSDGKSPAVNELVSVTLTSCDSMYVYGKI